MVIENSLISLKGGQGGGTVDREAREGEGGRGRETEGVLWPAEGRGGHAAPLSLFLRARHLSLSLSGSVRLALRGWLCVCVRERERTRGPADDQGEPTGDERRRDEIRDNSGETRTE